MRALPQPPIESSWVISLATTAKTSQSSLPDSNNTRLETLARPGSGVRCWIPSMAYICRQWMGKTSATQNSLDRGAFHPLFMPSSVSTTKREASFILFGGKKTRIRTFLLGSLPLLKCMTSQVRSIAWLTSVALWWGDERNQKRRSLISWRSIVQSLFDPLRHLLSSDPGLFQTPG